MTGSDCTIVGRKTDIIQEPELHSTGKEVSTAMRVIKHILGSIVLLFIPINGAGAQSVHVNVGKLPAIPKVCEGLVSTDIEGALDIPGLSREVDCKGSGDMLIEYTYVMEYTSHSRDKKGREESETRVFEVYIPTLKDGARTRGVLIMTSRNGVPIPETKMEKVRREAGEQLEREEARVAKQRTVEPAVNTQPVVGLKPLGMYPRLTTQGSVLGFNRYGITLDVHTLLRQSSLTYLGREDIDGRENMVFAFVPDTNAKLDRFEEYVAKVRGKLWIDAKDRIVTRLAAWPTAQLEKIREQQDKPTIKPAIYLEMSRLPDGNWLPRVTRILASEYPELFGGIITDSIVKYSDYQRFKTESKDARMDGPKVP